MHFQTTSYNTISKLVTLLFVFSLLVSSDVFGQYQLHTEFGDTVSCNYRTGGIFAVWWDANFDHYEDAGQIIDDLMSIRDICLNENGLQDPPNPGQGYYYNVYMHHPDDIFSPKGFGNGQGTDKYYLPYLAMPYYNGGLGNLLHEGFHIFQYSSNSPGFDYSGDKGWFIEASANWFRALQQRDQEDVFVTAASISANPQMPLWRSWNNIEQGESENWQRSVRQYALNTLLYYLTEEAGVSNDVISGGFYANTSLSPQEYLSEQIGPATMRQYFADWAAHNTAEFDYLTPEQWARAQQEILAFGDPADYHDIVHTFTDEGTGSQGITPDEDYVTRGWSYNVYKLNNSSTDTYTFLLDGEEHGTENGAAFFEGRVIVMNGGTPTYYPLEMISDQDGMLTLDVTPSDSEIFLVVSATPDHFGSNQKYYYQVKIYKGIFADFNGSPSTGFSPLTVQFTDQSSGSISSYLWDFGDGETSIEQNPSHTYVSIGQYDVTLKIVREGNENDEITKESLISVIENPQKPFTGTPLIIPGIIEAEDYDNGGEGVAYHDSESDNYGGAYRSEEGVDIESCSEGGYDVGWLADGEWLEYTVNIQTAGSYSISFRLASQSEGSRFHIEVNDVDVTGSQYFESTGGWQTWKTNTIMGVSLQAGKQVMKFVSEGQGFNFNNMTFVNDNVFAGFGALPTSGTVPLTVQFSDSSTGIISSRLWDFGDGNTSSIQHPKHIYESVGNFSVSLVVTGSTNSDTLSKTNFINVQHTKTQALFVADITSGTPPLTVQFSDSSTGIINSWLWNFGDGDTSDIQHPKHIYDSVGNFSVSLIVNGPGGLDTLSKNSYIKVQHPKPQALFAADTTSGVSPLTVQFSDSSTGLINSWLWNFGDGDTSVIQHPKHIYNSVGNFSVSLIVSGPGGLDTLSKNSYIKVQYPKPKALFTADTTSGVAPLTVQFSDSSSGVINSWLWNFGDGDTSVIQHPKHTYKSIGDFSVSLVVNGPGGSDTLTNNSYINVSGDVNYHGEPFTIPGLVEAEDFDNGGEGVAYHDVDSENSGNAYGNEYRTEEGVDIESCSAGGYNVGWIFTDEWLKYTVDVQAAGSYSIAVQFASDSDGSRFHIEFDDVDVTGSQYFEKTGGWQTWKTETIAEVSLQAGEQVMKFVSEGDNYNLNNISIFTTVDIENQIGLPTEYMLGQNYPNPFNPSTSIAYELPENTHVNISIYDVNGHLIEILVNENKNPGRYTVKWIPENLVTGVYFFKIKTKSFHDIKKCILLK